MLPQHVSTYMGLCSFLAVMLPLISGGYATAYLLLILAAFVILFPFITFRFKWAFVVACQEVVLKSALSSIP